MTWLELLLKFYGVSEFAPCLERKKTLQVWAAGYVLKGQECKSKGTPALFRVFFSALKIRTDVTRRGAKLILPTERGLSGYP